jgi:hypothetical protein
VLVESFVAAKNSVFCVARDFAFVVAADSFVVFVARPRRAN